MTDITPPQECDWFQNLNDLDKTIALKEYIAKLERLTNDAQHYLGEALKGAAEQGLENGEYYVQVRYKEGKSYAPDPELLKENFPEKYQQWLESELTKFKPKMTKTAFERLWTTTGHTRAEKKESKERNQAEMQTCMKEHPVNPQYILSSVAEREAWKAAHPIEEEADA